MPAKSIASNSATFMIVGFNDQGRVAAAAHFIAAPDSAWHEAKQRAHISGFRKFQLYQIEVSQGPELKFVPMK